MMSMVSRRLKTRLRGNESIDNSTAKVGDEIDLIESKGSGEIALTTVNEEVLGMLLVVTPTNVAAVANFNHHPKQFFLFYLFFSSFSFILWTLSFGNFFKWKTKYKRRWKVLGCTAVFGQKKMNKVGSLISNTKYDTWRKRFRNFSGGHLDFLWTNNNWKQRE